MEKSLRLLANVIDTRMNMSDKKPSIPQYSFRGRENRIPSADVTAESALVALVKPPMVYSGDKMVGIGQLHKSNAVPIFRTEDIEDLSHMRR